MKTPLTRLLYTIAAAFSLGIIAASTAAADEAQPAKAAAKVVAALDNIASISRPVASATRRSGATTSIFNAADCRHRTGAARLRAH